MKCYHPQTTDEDTIVIESDNCRSRYKSAHQFFDIQNIANLHQKTVIQLQGKVDHVGDIAKVAVSEEISRGEVFSNAFLQDDLHVDEFVLPYRHMLLLHHMQAKSMTFGF